MMHYLAVTGLERAYLAVLINCRDLQIYELERDEAEIRLLMEAEELFWRHVTEDTQPPADGSEATAGTLRELYPGSDGSTAFVFGLDNLLNRRALLRASIKDLEQGVSEIDNQIKAGMGEADRAVCDVGTVTWKSQTRSAFDRKAFERPTRRSIWTPTIKPPLTGCFG